MLKVVVVLVTLSGCSFFTMHSPHGPGPPECNDGYEFPMIDVIAAVAAPFIVWEIARPSNPQDPGAADIDAALATFFIGAPIAGAVGTSAIYGFIKRDRCERGKRDYVQLVTPPPMLVPAPPPAYPGGPPPAQ